MWRVTLSGCMHVSNEEGLLLLNILAGQRFLPEKKGRDQEIL